MSKTIQIIIGVVVIAVVAFGGVYAYQWKMKNDYTQDLYKAAQEKKQSATSTSASETSSSTQSARYTLADVSTHNSVASCWAIVNSNVYDLTSWISKHPGGERAITEICGKDGTRAFNSEHGRDEMPKEVLEMFLIGGVR